MFTNYENVIQLWRMVDSMFFATKDYLDKFDSRTPEIERFKDAYYEFMGAVNRLHDYARTLPF